jgi:hypothetical protein
MPFNNLHSPKMNNCGTFHMERQIVKLPSPQIYTLQFSLKCVVFPCAFEMDSIKDLLNMGPLYTKRLKAHTTNEIQNM